MLNTPNPITPKESPMSTTKLNTTTATNGPAQRLTPEIEAALRGTTLAERLRYSTPVPGAASARTR
jgi:hypothetical protein